MDYYHTSFSSGDHQSYSSTPPHVLMMNNNNNNQIQMVGGEIKKSFSTSSSSSSLRKEIRGKKNSTSSSSSKSGGGVRLSTDPQSVAARERRHRISERFKILQSLVPGGSKMDTVSMLEEAIHYVKFLKTQISLHQSIINNNLINNINHEIHNLINEYPSSSFDDHLLLFPNTTTTTTSTTSYNHHNHQLEEEEEEQPVIRPYCSLISNSDDNAVVPVVGVQEQIPAPFCCQDDHLHETMFLHEGHYYSISNY